MLMLLVLVLRSMISSTRLIRLKRLLILMTVWRLLLLLSTVYSKWESLRAQTCRAITLLMVCSQVWELRVLLLVYDSCEAFYGGVTDHCVLRYCWTLETFQFVIFNLMLRIANTMSIEFYINYIILANIVIKTLSLIIKDLIVNKTVLQGRSKQLFLTRVATVLLKEWLGLDTFILIILKICYNICHTCGLQLR